VTNWRDEFGGPALLDLELPVDDLDLAGDVCHRFYTDSFRGESDRAACGVPRSEQPDHGEPTPRYQQPAAQTHCPWCGNPICPRCREKIGGAVA
jgi:hypothetical protein